MIYFNLLEQQWCQIILGAIGTGVAGLIAYGFALLNAWISTNVKNKKVRAYLVTISGIIESSVISVQQTFVSNLIKQGKFDKAAQQEAFELAYKNVLKNLTAEGTKILSEVYPDVEAWIKQQIEVMVYNLLPHGNKEQKEGI